MRQQFTVALSAREMAIAEHVHRAEPEVAASVWLWHDAGVPPRLIDGRSHAASSRKWRAYSASQNRQCFSIVRAIAGVSGNHITGAGMGAPQVV